MSTQMMQQKIAEYFKTQPVVKAVKRKNKQYES